VRPTLRIAYVAVDVQRDANEDVGASRRDSSNSVSASSQLKETLIGLNPIAVIDMTFRRYNRMSRKLVTRLFALVVLAVLLAVISTGSRRVKAQTAFDPGCRLACSQDYQDCMSYGCRGCDTIFMDCVNSCD